MTATVPLALLCADDFALTEGVSRGIEELARAGRLSATSALVTTRHWPDHARRVSDLRRHVQVGLHLNLTLGAPLGPLPRLAPQERFPAVGALASRALAGQLGRAEIEAEFARQIDAFRSHAGRDPDFLDGHQHVHAFPVVRDALMDALARAFPDPRRRPWVRDPADALASIVARGHCVRKAATLAVLARGFGRSMIRAGMVINQGFAGVSAFDRRVPYEDELAAQFRAPGPRHLIMCHPGHVDDELRLLDPVVERRADEFTALMTSPWLPSRIVTGGYSWPATGSEVAT